MITIALGIGIYLIVTTTLISKDGILYIECAQQLSSKPIAVIKTCPPGFPFLIFITHKIVMLFNNNMNNQIWVYSAQSIALMCRLLSIIPLYIIGKRLVGSKKSFWGVLILIFLPYPAEFGSDVLREWPHILFLSTGMLFLMSGGRSGKWWDFLLAGFVAGLGHTIRPECAIIVIIGMGWGLRSFFLPKSNFGKLKTVGLIFLLTIGFAISTVPYCMVKGQLLPDKLKTLISGNAQVQSENILDNNLSKDTQICCLASTIAVDVLKAFIRLLKEISENVMYFFVMPLILGICYRFKKSKGKLRIEELFTFSLVLIYLLMMMSLCLHWGYISRRHCLPMVVFTAFYIPSGLFVISVWINKIISGNNSRICRNMQKTFFILVIIGIGICLPKLFKITGEEKHGYKEAIGWLSCNTSLSETVAVQDRRISFYAERKGVIYDSVIPPKTKYVVWIFKNGEEDGFEQNGMQLRFSAWTDNKKKKKIVIYETSWND